MLDKHYEVFMCFTRKRSDIIVHLVLLTLLMTAAFFTTGCGESTKRKSWRDQEKARTLLQATREYAEKHHKSYPDAAQWEGELKPFLPRDFRFTLDTDPSHRFAMNSVFSRKKTTAFTDGNFDQAALYFESTKTTPSAHDELISVPRSGDAVIIAYRLGHVYSHRIEWVGLLDDPLARKRFVGK